MTDVTRTVVVRSARLPRRVFRVFVELEGMYRNMVEQLVMYVVRNEVSSFTKLKALKYCELRGLYPHLPSHYAYTACQDASTRVKSFLRLRKRGLTSKEYPEVKSVSVWLDDHLWRLSGLTSLSIATHKGRVTVELESHKQYWKYISSGWRLASEARIRLDKKNKQLTIYLVFTKDVEEHKPRGYLPVDVNENNVAILVDGYAYIFGTDMEKLVLGYYYRRKRVQEKYDELYGVKSRAKRKVFRELREKWKKRDIRWKLANIIVRVAYEKQCVIVLEKLGKKPTENMIKRIKDRQLRHRIYQASIKGIQVAIEEKAREYGVPVVYVDPRHTSKTCPVHKALINYNNGSRIGRCSKGGELWHRDVVACWNMFLRALGGDGSNAPNPSELDLDVDLDVSRMPFGTNATHDPTVVGKPLWTRWKFLDAMKNHKCTSTSIKGQTVLGFWGLCCV